jgi:serine/threonine protein kinase
MMAAMFQDPRREAHDPALSDPDEIEGWMIELLDLPAGERPGALERLVRAHPERHSRILERIELLRGVGIDVLPAREGTPSFPERLGDFRLLERLGGGGMGVVYLARQESLGREVALKLIRPEQLYFPGARARFQREVELIARLSHPGIVPVYVVGEENGIPYFAMQRIEGLSLAEILEAFDGRSPEELTGRDLAEVIARRVGREPASPLPALFAGTWVQCSLMLMRQIANAVEHAHERGILHRDIKPSNVLVTPDGRALLFDFGLASSAGTDRLTRTGSQVGSLPYMSPEHLRGEELDARSDVYALGVTSYELLTLRLPFEASNASRLREAILTAEAPALRSRNRAVAWDVETIAMTAMERERTRRYASAADFGADLASVLELRPIRARPPSRALRIRRFLQRHPTRSVAAALGLLALAIGPSVAAVMARISERRIQAQLELTDDERRRADGEARASEAMLAFVLSLFESSDPLQSGGRDPRASELLDAGAHRIQQEFAAEPRVQATLLERIARIELHLGRPAQAIELYERALEVSRASSGEESFEARHGLAKAKIAANELVEAEAILRELIATARREAQGDPAKLAHLQNELAAALVSQGKWEQAALVLSAIEDDALEDSARIERQCSFGYAIAGQGDAKSAEARFRAAIALAREKFPPPSLQLANALACLGWLLKSEPGRTPELVEVSREALEIRRALQGGRSIELALDLDQLACALGQLGEFDACLDAHRESIDLAREMLGEGNAHEASFLIHYGEDLSSAGDPEAEAILRRALELNQELPEREGGSVASAGMSLGMHLARAGRTREAVPCFDLAVRGWRGVQGGEPFLVAALGWLGRLHFELADLDAAVPCFEECLPLARTHVGTDSIDAALAARYLGACHLARGALDEAEPLLTAALPTLEKLRGPSAPDTRACARSLLELYEARGETALASELRARLAADLDK